ncbi:MAG: site-specific integrase [Anaerolineae bacterium]|nr:site-specific integrase [Anaerolineae bacterium]
MKRHPDALISRRNWRDTRAYLTYYEEVLHRSPGSIALYRTALDHLLRWATDVSFLHASDLRPVFPIYLAGLGKQSSGYQTKVLDVSRSFLEWARERSPDAYPGRVYRDTLYPASSDESVEDEMQIYTLEDMLMLAALPARNLTEQRDQAAACFLFLSGMRAGAFVSLPIEAVNLSRYEIRQWPSLGVKTKNRKAATTYMLQLPELEPLYEIVREWDTTVQRCLEPTAPWYALLDRNQNAFAADQTPGNVRTRNLARHLETLCHRARLNYLSPHKLRHGFAVYALQYCENYERFKTISQTLMHAQTGTTDKVYAKMMSRQIAKAMAEMGRRRNGGMSDEDIDRVAEALFRRLNE